MGRVYDLRRQGFNVHQIAELTGITPEQAVAALGDPSLDTGDSGGGGGDAGNIKWAGDYQGTPSPEPLPPGSLIRYNEQAWLVTGPDAMPANVVPGHDPNTLQWRGQPTGSIDVDPVVDGVTSLYIINENSAVGELYPGRGESKLIAVGVKCVTAGPVRLNFGVADSVVGFLDQNTELAIYSYEDQDTPLVTVDDGYSGSQAGIDGFQFDVGLYVIVGRHHRDDVDISGEYYFLWQPPGNQGSTPMRIAFFGPDEADFVDANWHLVAG